MSTIKCKVVGDKVWYSKENRFLEAGEVVEFPAEVVNHEGKTVPFKVGPSFERIVEGKKVKAGKSANDGNGDNQANDGGQGDSGQGDGGNQANGLT